jgi:tetratricopeptide (TPR) repeat protein
VAEAGATTETLFQDARSAMDRRDAPTALGLLRSLLASAPNHAQAWRLYGFALREEQQMAESLAAFRRAQALAPADPLTATAIAETSVQCGLAAVELTRRALQLAPRSPSLLLTLASALIAAGQRAEAESVLEAQLRDMPGWLEGQYRLAEIRWTSGDTAHFARGYAVAAAEEPRNLRLRLAWFRVVAQARQWAQALEIVESGERLFGPQAVFHVARLYIASESGARDEAERLFELTRDSPDDVRGLAWIRHCLRDGRAAEAEPEALRLTETAAAAAAWPYLSLIWRLKGDARAVWLDGDPPYVRTFDLGLSSAELAELACLLRELHTARAPYLEQSVRGGTQTERPLFFRLEPIIAVTKQRIVAAVRDYVDALPPFQPGHPLLGTPRQPLRFGGSWSVRLERQGFNVAHTHPLGWLSSAFYVSLPTPDQMGPAPAGSLQFGQAPPELGLALPPYAAVTPRVGTLALFPSTMWHSTVPFDDGERLVLAFDVRTPAR